jgi:spermidine/putrescine ABC transporter ATP-binding subunit
MATTIEQQSVDERREPAGDRIGVHGARVVFDALEKHYGSVAAVDGISLDVAPGEFLTMLGPSGSGKTTSLMMLAGFEIPTAGEIYVDDRPVVTVPPYRRNIGMVFQNYALFPHMNVGENIAFPLKLRKLKRAEITRRTQEVLTLVGLPGYEQRYPRQLSGGQQQRVALARALVFNPRVLLMDEPLGALDKQLREHLQLEIKALHDQLGVTILYVTHDQQEALVMSDRIAVMNEGKIEQLGAPTELYEQPATRFVASFIGESNFLDCRILHRDGPLCQVDVPGVGVLRAPARNGMQVNQEVALTVRPEKIIFAGEPLQGDVSPERHDAVVEATIEAVIFVGETRRYQARLRGGQRVIVKRQNRTGIRPHERGDEVRLAWHLADSRVVW